jgi:hypothetical protein
LAASEKSGIQRMFGRRFRVGRTPTPSQRAGTGSLCRVPSARTIARLMTTGRDTLVKSETIAIAAIEDGIPPRIEARAVIAAFHVMVRKKAEAELDARIEGARFSLVTSFFSPTESRRTRRPLAPRSPPFGPIVKQKDRSQNSNLGSGKCMGRPKIDLPEARLIGAAGSSLHQICVRAYFGCVLAAVSSDTVSLCV